MGERKYIWFAHMQDTKYELVAIGKTKEEANELIKAKFLDFYDDVWTWDSFIEEHDGVDPIEWYGTWFNKFKIGKAYTYGCEDES